MFADPQSVTIDAVATPFNKVGSTQPDRKGVYTNADNSVELWVTQNKTAGRFRRELRLTTKKVAADPISAVNKEVSSSVIIVVDEPRYGFSDAELKVQIQAALDWANVSTNVDQLLGGEF
jgi:hypothetical protein